MMTMIAADVFYSPSREQDFYLLFRDYIYIYIYTYMCVGVCVCVCVYVSVLYLSQTSKTQPFLKYKLNFIPRQRYQNC